MAAAVSKAMNFTPAQASEQVRKRLRRDTSASFDAGKECNQTLDEIDQNNKVACRMLTDNGFDGSALRWELKRHSAAAAAAAGPDEARLLDIQQKDSSIADTEAGRRKKRETCEAFGATAGASLQMKCCSRQQREPPVQ